MKSAAGGTVVAVLLFVVAVACWSEARVVRSVADAHRRLATLHYDADDGLDRAASVWNRLPWPAGASEDDVRRQRATTSYWREQYQSLMDLTLATGAGTLTDPHMLLVAANAAFRASQSELSDRKTGVGRLDTLMLSYADVLRRDPNVTDAAYNYEYLSRLRDTLAKGPAPRGRTQEKSPGPEDVTVDLPSGPTIHGRPGAPPAGAEMSDFKTITPMRFDEREDQIEPGRGRQIRRKG
jgi:hypothetical protein